MPFRRMNSRLHPVNTKKHVIDEQGGLVAGTQIFTGIADGVDAPVLAQTDECAVGSYVRSIFLNVQVAATGSGALANVYLIVYKNPSNALPAPAANAIGSSDVKKIVFHQEMLMVQRNTTGNPRTLFKGVLKIPRHMQRMGQDDTIIASLLSVGVNMDYCIECIYKEIR